MKRIDTGPREAWNLCFCWVQKATLDTSSAWKGVGGTGASAPHIYIYPAIFSYILPILSKFHCWWEFPHILMVWYFTTFIPSIARNLDVSRRFIKRIGFSRNDEHNCDEKLLLGSIFLHNYYCDEPMTRNRSHWIS